MELLVFLQAEAPGKRAASENTFVYLRINMDYEGISGMVPVISAILLSRVTPL